MSRTVRQFLVPATAVVVAVVSFIAVAPARSSAAVPCTKTWTTAVSGTWNDGTRWSPSGVPTSGDSVCITADGTYTVTVDSSLVASNFQVGGTSGTATLAITASCAGAATLTVTGSSTIKSHGALALDATGCAGASTLSATTASSKLVNNGTITSSVDAGGSRDLSMSTINKGTVNVNVTLDSVFAFSFVNRGVVMIADGQLLEWQNGDFTDDTGGSIVATGTGSLFMGGGGTYHQGDGTATGTAPVTLTGTNVDYTGSGTSTIDAQSTATLSGNVAVGQTLNLDADGVCGFDATLQVNSSFTNAGTINLDASTCAKNAAIIAPDATPTLTNTGVINANHPGGGSRDLRMSTVNDGTVNVNATLDSVFAFSFVNRGVVAIADGQTLAWHNGDFTEDTGGSIAATGTGSLSMGGGGTYHQGDGTATGTTPVILTGTNVDYTGTGSSTISAQSTATLSGNVVVGQTLNLDGDGVCTFDAILQVNNSFTNAGTINLDGSGCAKNAAIVAPDATPTLTNTGVINANHPGGGSRDLRMSTVNDGTINVNATLDSVFAFSFVNRGAVTIADGQLLEWHNGDFTNDTGGSITATGSGLLFMGGGGTYHQGNGTATGTAPVVLTGTNVDYTGTGASTIDAQSIATLTGDVAIGQTLNLDSNGACVFDATLQVNSSFTNAGTINLDASSCATNAAIVAPNATLTLTNTGVINADHSAGGTRDLEMSTINNGTINVNATLDAVVPRSFSNNGTINVANGQLLKWRNGAFTNAAGAINGGATGKVTGSGAFTEGNGVTTGATPVVRTGSISYTGGGKSAIIANGTGGRLSGALVAGQSLDIQATCSLDATRTITTNVTNGGAITLSSVGCGKVATLTAASATPRLTNTGTLTTDATLGGARNFATSIVNDGTFNVNQTATSTAPRSFTNDGVVTIADGMVLDWSDGDFTDATGGSIVAIGSAELTMSGGTYHQGGGGTTGIQPVEIDNGNVDFNAAGSGARASHVVARGTIGNLTGTILSKQSLVIQATCDEAATRTTTAPSFTNDGRVTLASSSCANNATLDATGRTFLNAGTLLVDDAAAGSRTILGNVTNTGAVSIGTVPLFHKGARFRSNGTNSSIIVRIASATSFGRIDSSGSFSLGGVFTIATDPGFWPKAGEDFAVINGTNARTGNFATVSGTTAAGETVTYSAQYSANSMNLHAS